MLAIGDLLWIESSSLPEGWYILKYMTHVTCGVIDMVDGKTQYINLMILNDFVRKSYSRRHLEYLRRCRSQSVQRYFELMGVPERINWIVEGF